MNKHLTSAKSTKTITHNTISTPLLLLFIFFSFQLFAQIPAGYYDAASGQSGDQLKASLHNIIKGHTEFPYTSSSTDVWDILKDADRDPNNSGNVIGIYSGFSMDAAAEYASGSGWNREHVWAKSRGDFGTSAGAGTDCHHLRAADISTNSARNNRNFDYADDFYIDGSGTYSGPTESKTSSVNYVWEPRDEVKGDVARMIFYMATRYEGDTGEPDLELTETLLDNTDKSPIHARLSVLLEWHQLDPVTDAERTRNDIIYGYQNNRNPFIDHPEYVCLIYACDGTPSNTAPSFSSNAVTAITEGETYQYNIVSTDAEADAISISATTLPSWLALTDNGNGTALLSGSSSSVQVGTHDVVLSATDGQLSSMQSFTITVSAQGTGGGSATASDLFISEYIEGSSYNKGLEIANFTGAAIDLSNYSLFKQTNGAGAWSSELPLSGTLADGAVYVVVHSSADAAMQAEADLSTGVAALSFNGNDPVALFKNGSLLDAVGVLDNTSDFAKDVTLVRKAAINSPNTTYTVAEWEQLASDTFTNLGSHTITLGTGGGSDTEAPSTPINVTASGVTSTSFNINWDASTDNIGVENYTVYLDGNVIATIGNTTYSFTALQASTGYLVNVVANDAAGNTSAQSTSISVTTSSASDTEAPTAPQNVQVSNVTSDSFDINWVASSDNVGVTAYDVLLDGTLVGTTTGLSYNFTGLNAASTYLVNVVAKDAAGNTSAQSTTISVTTSSASDTEAPTAPQNVQVSNVTSDSFDINWVASSDNVGVTAYDVLLDGTLVGTATGLSYNFTGLNEANTYLVNVVAKDAAGNTSAHSTTISVTTSSASDTEAPTAPQNVQVSNVTSDSFDINWVASSDNVGVTAYDVLLDGTLVGTTTGLSYNFTGLNAASTYLVNVVAKDAVGNASAQSATISVTTSNAADTEAPTAPTALNASNIGTTSFDVSWSAASDNVGVDYYQIYLNGIASATSTTLNYNFIGLTANTTYQVGVQAVDAAGNESVTTTVAVTTANSQTTAPQLLSESFFEAGWSDWISGGKNASYYSGSFAYEGNSAIRITDDRGIESSMESISLDVNSYNQLAFEFYFYANRMDYGDGFEIAYFDGLNWNVISTYTTGVDFEDRGFYTASVYVDRAFYTFPQNAKFRIQGLADNKRDQLYFDQITITGLSSDSALRQTSEGLLTTIERVGGEVAVVSGFSVFPNPATTGFIQLRKEYDEQTEVSVRLFDARGNKVYQLNELVDEGFFQPVINIQQLKAGVYFIELKDQKGFQELHKVVIR